MVENKEIKAQLNKMNPVGCAKMQLMSELLRLNAVLDPVKGLKAAREWLSQKSAQNGEKHSH